MAGQDYFKNALSDFTFEAANGGAIRHLWDLGYTVQQIRERLAFPASSQRVQECVWKHMLDKGMVLRQEPGSLATSQRTEFVREYDKYGRATFRRINITSENNGPIFWRELAFCDSSHGKLSDYLAGKCLENGEENAYISWDFGLWEKEDTRWDLLEGWMREYLAGLPWEKRIVYHRMDGRIREIICRLYENGAYNGTCYFVKIKEKITIMEPGKPGE